MISKLQPEDIANILEFLKEYYDEIDGDGYGHTFDPITVSEVMDSFCRREDTVALKYQENGHVDGVGVMIVIPSITNKNHHKGLEVIWHTSPKLTRIKRGLIMIKLLKEMEAWAREHGVKTIHIGTQRANDVSKYLQRHDYKMSEQIYVKEVSDES